MAKIGEALPASAGFLRAYLAGIASVLRALRARLPGDVFLCEAAHLAGADDFLAPLLFRFDRLH